MRRLLLFALFPLACSRPSESTPDPTPPDDAGADAQPDAKGPPQVVEAHDPTPVAVSQWMVARIADPAKDPVRAALDAGTFTMPSAGTIDGVLWRPIPPGKNGELGAASRTGLLYGAVQVELPSKTFVFGRFDNALGSWGNLVPQPADVYGSGRIRLPVASKEGTNLVVVRGFGGRGGQVIAQLWTTPDEVFFNVDDATLPDLVVGETAPQWMGVPVLNLTERTLLDVTARVEENATFAATETKVPALSGNAVTPIAFELRRKVKTAAPKEKLEVVVRLESPSLDAIYRKKIQVDTIAAGATHKRTFVSAIDGSAQYMGVVPPKDHDPSKAYGLVLALHGASVQGIGHAQAYSPKDWTWIVAPTNRRPFGFDWEEWGRLDALEILDLAQKTFATAPEKTYVTGHSMGGHGTWQMSVLFPGRFATAGPSAGWISFETYGGAPRATGAIGRATASSNTLDYVKNLEKRGVYILHGDADDNVPVSESRTMVEVLKSVTSDVVYHEQPGAGHWWDGDKAAGADCVDWPALFEFMQKRSLDPTELAFEFKTPSPWVSPRHSFVTVLSEKSAWDDVTITSAHADGTVTLTTKNARSMILDGKALRAKGVTKIVVDGAAAADVPDGPMPIGPQEGKRPKQHGPINEVFHRPFCFVYEGEANRRYAAWLVSQWALIGNGYACALPIDRVDDALRKERNLVYLGVPAAKIAALPKLFSWDDKGATVEGTRHEGGVLAVVFPDGERLAAAIAAPKGSETLLYRYQPFSSRAGMPDFFVYAATGLKDSGFFTPDWTKIDRKP